MALHPVLLAGGSGTRLWPLSRFFYPKQFLSLTGRRTMLQETLARLDSFPDVAPPIVVCNEEHRFVVAEQLLEADRTPLAIILESAGRNTAPALTIAVHQLLASAPEGDDPLVLVMPSDHLVRDGDAFRAAVRRGTTLAEQGYLVTFGVVPTGPETGYGYILKGGALGPDETGALELVRFVEKPDQDAAREYVESGTYLWNSGMFLMRASTWLDELERYRPDIASACAAAFENCSADGDFVRPDPALFASCPSESIDYAVMEKAAGATQHDRTAAPCSVVPLDAGWSDIGAWEAILDQNERDAEGNVVRGDVYTHDVTNTLLLSQHRLVAAVGLRDLIVVETADAILVAHKEHVQHVSAIVSRLRADGRREQEDHRRVHRPWGSYDLVDSGPGFQVKRLIVNPGAALSLQMHRHRAEHWVVVAGRATVTRGEEDLTLEANAAIDIPMGVAHRLENRGDAPLEIIEVQSGGYLGEDDIVRLDDRYARHLVTSPDGP